MFKQETQFVPTGAAPRRPSKTPLQRALEACKKKYKGKKNKAKLQKCEKAARKKYAKKPAKHTKKHSRRSNRSAAGRRRRHGDCSVPRCPASEVRAQLPSSSRSARVIRRMSSSKLVFGFQPRSRSALDASPTRWSTSAGRTKAGRPSRTARNRRGPPRRRRPHSIPAPVGLAGGDHVVLGLLALEHQPHRFHVVLGVTPVALCVEVAQPQLALRDRA